jgi:hypothetical protein
MRSRSPNRRCEVPCRYLPRRPETHGSGADHRSGRQLPFDTSRTYALQGALTQLPFQALVTTGPTANGADVRVSWLIRGLALTVLPSVASLKALRQLAKDSRAGC